ncbi:RnfG2 [Desulfamplus magnetovallimortis]|uniref:Ion-translocating oxidoreductase complex subunit G n=1 Tax=Desulfamplus magnetovallimortis TaxID=1246637 RepID=A0A1W1H502_9BACT|nr:RnfABCDGE type electron transport complex subunit G [Desulfamplus magnetovallimortis]SLM27522.1 RnfG2 [Desulfamplus magnetovallimortis]
MREMISMVVVLTVLSAFSGGMLAAVKTGTNDKIENQVLKFQKAPAIKLILSDVSNDPLQDRFKIMDQEEEVTFFVGKYDGTPKAITFETKGKGFGGDIGLMVGVNIESDEIIGVAVTTHSETPGLGSRAKDDPKFVSQFAGKTMDKNLGIKKSGGEIDAMSGATITSVGVCLAAQKAQELYTRLKPEIEKQTAQMAN